jgi:hypothetical protein
MSLVLHGGHGKTLFLTRDSIRIVREQLDERHDTAILIRHIAAIDVKKPGAFDGFIHFSIAGGRTPDSGHGFTGGSFDAARDEHAVTFSSLDEYDVALKIKLHVETWSPALHATPASPADEVRELKLEEGR